MLGGRAMEIVYDGRCSRDYLERRRARSGEIFLDRFLENAIEVDVDAICDGEDVWIGGIMQHVEEAGIHSGDSACVLPPHSLGAEMLAEICARDARHRARARRRRADQRPVRRATASDLYVIEANPRASRTVPFVSKATGLPLAKLACRVMLGEKLADSALPDGAGGDHVSVKEAVLPFDRFAGADALLGPEMRSTGEVMGVAADFPAAFAKAQAAAGAQLPHGRHGVPHRHRLRQGRRSWASPRSCTTSASGSSPPAAPPPRSRAWASRWSASTRSGRARRTSSTGSSAATSTS